jgi:hypothetical protein
MTQPVRRSRRDADKDQELLRRLRERLQQIKRQMTDIGARVDALRTTEKAVTLREFTEKQLNGKRSDDQETYASRPRTAAEKYTAG